MVSQYLGARNREALSGTIGTCIMLTAIASLIIMVNLRRWRQDRFLELLNTPDSIFGLVYFLFENSVFGRSRTFIYNILSGVLRGLGDSMSALLYLLSGKCVEYCAGLTFCSKVWNGCKRVALATAIAQEFQQCCACEGFRN